MAGRFINGRLVFPAAAMNEHLRWNTNGRPSLEVNMTRSRRICAGKTM